VQIKNQGRCINYNRNTEANATELPKYVIFPLDNTKDENKHYVKAFTLKEGISFDLHLIYPSDREKELFTAVKLWLLFGGIGARTRRGMGSLYCGTWTGWQSGKDVVDWLQKVIPAGNSSDEPKWPSLIGGRLQLIEKGCHTNIMELWRGWMNNYQRFRQSRDYRRHSVWPEPNAIRTLCSKNSFGSDAYFPRGAYGLPILFYFGERDPLNCTLCGFSDNVMERWSSPVILKVARLSQDKCLKICLKLNSPLPEGWCLKRESDEKKLPPSAYPMADHPAKNGDALHGNDSYTALFKAMAQEDPVTLGKGGRI
jgi:CRISPR-associated protein Cmr1